MNVIVINESEGKAWVRSRRVLSRYLPQLGSRTWSGQISSEGLESLRLLLKKSASKSTAIACHRIASRSRIELLFTVGSTAPFDERGRFAFRVSEHKDCLQPVEPGLALAGALQGLSGLSHDLAKIILPFQEKLRKGFGYEALRHDVLSMMLVKESLDELAQQGDAAWLSALVGNPERLAACATRTHLLSATGALVQKAIVYSNGGPDNLLYLANELEQEFRSAPVFAALLWLVLTHHRLPASDTSEKALALSAHVHRLADVREGRTFTRAEDCLVLAPGTPPWQEQRWRSAVSVHARAALEALSKVGTVETTKFIPLVAHVFRPTLILADHLASAQAQDSGPIKDQRDILWANTVGPGGRNAGDRLVTHLLSVGRLAPRVLNIALGFGDAPVCALPGYSSVFKAPPSGYEWQEELGGTCAQARKIGPTFVVLASGTGSGKTVAGLRAATELTGNRLRLTVPMSQRALTTQSMKAFVEDAQVPATAIMVAIGHPQTVGLDDKHDRELEKERAAFDARGSESAHGGEDALSLLTVQSTSDAVAFEESEFASGCDTRWLHPLGDEPHLERIFGKKTLQLLSAPVLGCTADHLVGAVELLRGGDARAFLRLTTSDLLLDEIDSYGGTDLQSIAALAFLAGIGGRHVIVMSATMSPPVSNGLFRAWRAGLEVRRACGLSASFRQAVVLAAKGVSPVLLRDATDEQYRQRWADFTASLVRHYDTAPRRKTACVLPLVPGSATDVYEQMFEHCLTFHDSNACTDPATGKRVSMGFVRLNTTRHAWQFGRYLLQAKLPSEKVAVRVLTYHAKYPRTYLGVLESTLRSLTNRKRDPHAWLSLPLVQSALAATDATELVIIVPTTSIIETGRDFDFDWKVSEPRTMTALEQGGGRVRRHRFDSFEQVNLGLLSAPLAYLIRDASGRPASRIWRSPGIEDRGDHCKVLERLSSDTRKLLTTPIVEQFLPAPGKINGPPPNPRLPTRVLLTDETFPVQQIEKNLHAGLCLLSPESYERNRIGYLEQLDQALNLCARDVGVADFQLPQSFASYLAGLYPLNREHARKTRFRQSAGRDALFRACAGSGTIEYFDPVSKRYVPCTQAAIAAVPSSRALLVHDTKSLERRAQRLGEGLDDPYVGGCRLQLRGDESAQSKVLTWSEFLGFLEGKAEDEE